MNGIGAIHEIVNKMTDKGQRTALINPSLGCVTYFTPTKCCGGNVRAYLAQRTACGGQPKDKPAILLGQACHQLIYTGRMERLVGLGVAEQ